jgi:hypothetical protein
VPLDELELEELDDELGLVELEPPHADNMSMQQTTKPRQNMDITYSLKLPLFFNTVAPHITRDWHPSYFSILGKRWLSLRYNVSGGRSNNIGVFTHLPPLGLAWIARNSRKRCRDDIDGAIWVRRFRSADAPASTKNTQNLKISPTKRSNSASAAGQLP